MANLAERLLHFQEYKEEINNGFFLEKSIYGDLKKILFERNYYLSKEGDPNNGGNIFVKNDILKSHIFVDFDITTLTHGFSYLTSNNVAGFIEAYNFRQESEKNRLNCSDEKGMLNGILMSIPFEFPAIMGVYTLGLNPIIYLIPPILGGIAGVYYNRKKLPNLQRIEGLAIKDQWKQTKNIKHGWNALEEALK